MQKFETCQEKASTWPKCSSSLAIRHTLPATVSGRNASSNGLAISGWPIQAPPDGSCFFWAVALSYLIPARDSDAKFTERCANIFGEIDTEKVAKVREFLQSYNPLLHTSLEPMRALVTQVFRNRVVDYVENNRNLFQHVLDPEKYVKNKRRPDSWADEPEIHAVMAKFNIDVNIIGGAGVFLDHSLVGAGYQETAEVVTVSLSYDGSHYNYYLDQSIIDHYSDAIVGLDGVTLQQVKNRFKKSVNIAETEPKRASFCESEVKLTLSKQDIIDLAEIEYGWVIKEDDVILYVVNQLSELMDRLGSSQLEELKSNPGKSLTYIADLGSDHWVTLVVVYRDQLFLGYYVDPLGGTIPDSLKCYLTKTGIHCPNIKFKQTECNTGIFALKNAKAVNFAEKTQLQVEEKTAEESKFLVGVANDLFEKVLLGLSEYRELALPALKDQVKIAAIRLKVSKEVNNPAKQKASTFIITPDDKSNDWAVLSVGIFDGQMAACYVANTSYYTEYVRNLLSENGIVIICMLDSPEEYELSKYSGAEYLIWYAAESITNFFISCDHYVSIVLKGVGLVKRVVNQAEVNKVRRKIEARRKIDYKIKTCRKALKKYKNSALENQSFSYVEANLLVLFLESVGFEDPDMSAALGESLGNIKSMVIDVKDAKIVEIIRSKYLTHREDADFFNFPRKSDLFLSIGPKDLQKFVKDGFETLTVFQRLYEYLIQVSDRLNHKTVHRTREIRICDLFKSASQLNRDDFIQRQDVQNCLAVKYSKLLHPNFLLKNTELVMFNLTVNMIPSLEYLYSRDASKVADEKLTVDELQTVRRKTNELVFKFHKYSSHEGQIYELESFIDAVTPAVLKYCQGEV